MGNEEVLSAANSLLAEVYQIVKKYDEIAKITGEGFNAFEVLGLRKDEDSHSRVIAELLDPKGSHGKGNEFLELFLPIIGEDIHTFKDAKVKREESFVNGRIDIFIIKNQKEIVIENKIEADDQDMQLLRYRTDHPTAKIVYLTLDGREPSEGSTGGNKNSYDKLLSYKDDIIPWLEECLKKSVRLPFMRETIAQYIDILKDLTEQGRRQKMRDEIVGVLKSSENAMATAFEIAPCVDDIKKKAVEGYFVPAMEKIKGLKYDPNHFMNHTKLGQQYGGMSFTNELLETNEMRIRLEFTSADFKELRYGFCWKNKGGDQSKLYKYIESIKINGRKKYGGWPLCKVISEHQNWGAKEFFDLHLGEEKSEVIKICKKALEELLGILGGFEDPPKKH